MPGELLVAIGGVGLALAAGAFAIGRRRQRRELGSLVARLADPRRSDAPARPDAEELARLPAPVARYLRVAMPGRQRIDRVRLRQAGRLRTGVHRGRWLAFEAEHVAAPGADYSP